jgi:hypothetical protein
MADDIQLPPGYEDTKPMAVSNANQGIVLPPGYEDTTPMAAASPSQPPAPADKSGWD